MSWVNPKTWGVENVGTSDLNRIEENIRVLGSGGGKTVLATAASAGELTLPNSTDDVYMVTGTTSIEFIDTTNREPGNKIYLIFQDTGCGITQGSSSPSDPKFKPIYYSGVGTLTGVNLAQRSNWRFVYTGVYWSVSYTV